MILTLLLICGAMLGGWSFLSVLGNERQRQAQARDAAAPPAHAPPVQTTPHTDSV